MLVLKGVSQLVGHDHALVVEWNPVGDIELVSLWVVQAGDLFGEQFDHKGVQVKILWQQAKRFRGFGVSVALPGVLIFIHLPNDISSNFIARRTNSAWEDVGGGAVLVAGDC